MIVFFLTKKKDIFEPSYIYLFHKRQTKKKIIQKYNEQKFNQKGEKENIPTECHFYCVHILFKLCALNFCYFFFIFLVIFFKEKKIIYF